MRIFCRKIRLYSIHVKLVEFKRRWYVCTKFLATKSIDRLRINAWIRQLYWIGGKWEISDKLINYSAFHRLFLFLILFNDMCQVLQHAFSTHIWKYVTYTTQWPNQLILIHSTTLTPPGPPGVSREAKSSTEFKFGCLVR